MSARHYRRRSLLRSVVLPALGVWALALVVVFGLIGVIAGAS